MAFSESETNALSIVSILCSVLSLGACFFIILCWILFKDLRKLAYGFVFYMSIATVIRTLSKAMGAVKGSAICAIQGFLITYGGLSTFYWIMTVAIVMYTMIFKPFWWFEQRRRIKQVNKWSIIINFGVPFIFALLPTFAGEYVSTGGWCWIDGSSTEGKIFRWISYYGQLMIILIWCIYVYCHIYYYLKFSPGASEIKNTKKLYSRIKYYPIALLMGYTVATLNRFVNLWDIETPFAWQMIQAITTGLFGFMLLFVYGRIDKMYNLFKEHYPTICVPFCDHLCCCFAPKEDNQTDNEQSKMSKTGDTIADTTKNDQDLDLDVDEEDNNNNKDTVNNLQVDTIPSMKMSGSTRKVLQESVELQLKQDQLPVVSGSDEDK